MEILPIDSIKAISIDTEEQEAASNPRKGPRDNIHRLAPKYTEDDITYFGQWKNGKRDGFGKLIKDNDGIDVIFTGTFENDSANGYGKIVNGFSYIGRWNDFRFGSDMIINYKAPLIVGEWKDNLLNGYGSESQIKETYEGEYYQGVKHGIGMLSLEDNAGYRGEFARGHAHGVGTFFFSDGRKYEGEWQNNKMHGYGIITWPDGKYFMGHFNEDKKEGFGIFYSHLKTYLGYWRNSKLEGEVILMEKGEMKKQFWVSGKKMKIIPKDHFIGFEILIKMLLI